MDKRYRSDIRQKLQRQTLSGAAAATVLGRRDSIVDIVRISSTLNNSDPAMRQETIKNLTRIGGKEAAMAVARCLRDPYPSVRSAACEALGNMRAHVAKAQLYDALYDSDPVVCCNAAGALAVMGDKAGMPQIIKMLCTPGKHQLQSLRSLNVIAKQDFRINPRGLEDAIRWIKAKKKHLSKP
jgi:HEAT repeat protein